MTKEMKEKYFLKQLPQLKGFAFRLSKKYNIEYEEVESRIYYRFCEVIDRYEEKKASIYTYLMHQLKLVNNELLKMKKEKNKEINLETIDYILGNKGGFIKQIEFYDLYKKELSVGARNIIEYILSNREKNISYDFVCKYFCKELGWKTNLFRDGWEEIKVWWRNNNFIFC